MREVAAAEERQNVSEYAKRGAPAPEKRVGTFGALLAQKLGIPEPAPTNEPEPARSAAPDPRPAAAPPASAAPPKPSPAAPAPTASPEPVKPTPDGSRGVVRRRKVR
jgi:hypothetical protein